MQPIKIKQPGQFLLPKKELKSDTLAKSKNSAVLLGETLQGKFNRQCSKQQIFHSWSFNNICCVLS